MKIAIIGSRKLNIERERIVGYIPFDCEEIVSGGAEGVDRSDADFARERGIAHREFLPQYDKYGRGAPIVRNRKIVDYADEVIAFWDGSSRGTLSVIEYCKKAGKPCRVIFCDRNS